MKKFFATPAAKMAAIVTILAMSLVGANAASATAPATTASAAKPVAHNRQGDLSSRIVGTTARGQRVTGSFVPLKFSRHNGKLFVRGLVQGVVHQANGTTSTFAQLKTVRVKSLNGTPARAGSARATCNILNLVLAPLDLNLLGLQVHLDRVVLNIVAVSGAGNLLGNLLCAVAGLLDGGIGGALARLTNLLNQILGALRLG
jgi:hypothetical protein